MFVRRIEPRVAHRDGDEGGVDRIAAGVAEVRHRAAGRVRQQEPVAMAAFLEEPRLRQAAETEMRHAENDRIRHRRHGGAAAEDAVDLQYAERDVHV